MNRSHDFETPPAERGAEDTFRRDRRLTVDTGRRTVGEAIVTTRCFLFFFVIVVCADRVGVVAVVFGVVGRSVEVFFRGVVVDGGRRQILLSVID